MPRFFDTFAPRPSGLLVPDRLILEPTAPYRVRGFLTTSVVRGPRRSSAVVAQASTNEPAGLTRFFENDFATWPATNPGTATVIVGSAVRDAAGGADPAVMVVANVTTPSGDGKALRYTHKATTRPGYTWYNSAFAAWDGVSHEYSEIYERTTLKLEGATWEIPDSLSWKVLSYWGVGCLNGATHGNPSELISLVEAVDYNTTNAPHAPQQATTFRLVAFTQGIHSDRISPIAPDQALVVVGQWHVIENYMKLNDIGSANGIWRWWLDGVLVGNHTTMEFIDAGHSAGFYGRNFNPIWGGSSNTIAGTGDNGKFTRSSGTWSQDMTGAVVWFSVTTGTGDVLMLATVTGSTATELHFSGDASTANYVRFCKSRDDSYLIDHMYMSGVYLR